MTAGLTCSLPSPQGAKPKRAALRLPTAVGFGKVADDQRDHPRRHSVCQVCHSRAPRSAFSIATRKPDFSVGQTRSQSLQSVQKCSHVTSSQVKSEVRSPALRPSSRFHSYFLGPLLAALPLPALSLASLASLNEPLPLHRVPRPKDIAFNPRSLSHAPHALASSICPYTIRWAPCRCPTWPHSIYPAHTALRRLILQLSPLKPSFLALASNPATVILYTPKHNLWLATPTVCPASRIRLLTTRLVAKQNTRSTYPSEY